MSPEVFSNAKNLFLIFPPGCGGNHLANLLSLCPEFEPRYENDYYTDSMIKRYQTKFKYSSAMIKGNLGGTMAHFSYLENLQQHVLLKHKDWLINNQKINILCSHLYEYLLMHEVGLLDYLDNRIFCIFSFPEKDSLAHKRLYNGAWFNGETSAFPESEFQYTKEVVANGIQLKHTDKPTIIAPEYTFELDTDKFMSTDGFDYIKEVCYSEMGVTLPEIGKELHQLWLDTIKEAIS